MKEFLNRSNAGLVIVLAFWSVFLAYNIRDMRAERDRTEIRLQRKLNDALTRLKECQQTSQDCYINLELLKRACSGQMKKEPLIEIKP